MSTDFLPRFDDIGIFSLVSFGILLFFKIFNFTFQVFSYKKTQPTVELSAILEKCLKETKKAQPVSFAVQTLKQIDGKTVVVLFPNNLENISISR